jgi:hypothetical protein
LVGPHFYGNLASANDQLNWAETKTEIEKHSQMDEHKTWDMEWQIAERTMEIKGDKQRIQAYRKSKSKFKNK